MTAEVDAEGDLSRIYARYVPRLIIERLVRESRAVDAPSAEGLRGAVLFADISGFTPLTETFAARGPEGAEALTRILNDYFGRMTEVVRAHGGDVLKFAGDALMAVWRSDDEAGLREACLRATACGLALQSGLTGYEAEGHPLSLRVAVGAGGLSVVHVGGQFDRWEFAIAGSPLNQVGRVGDLADRGEVLVSSEAWERIEQDCTGETVLTENAGPDLREWPPRRILEVRAPEPVHAPEPPILPPELEDALRGYLPASITRRIIAGQTDFLGELRRLTILFVNLPDITYSTPLDVAQQAFHGLQKALYLPWEGSINKLSVDDKGISLVAALGLPPFAHEDDAARGVQAAMAMHKVLADMGQRCSIGLSTGRVYCGSVGGSGRQEYTIMGDRVNLAARLMQNARGGILCDEHTAERSRQVVEFGAPEEIRVKGKSEALQVYRPLGQRHRGADATDLTAVIGRERELAQLGAALTEVIEQQRSLLVYAEGEAGIGKTLLLTRFVADAAAHQPVRLLAGGADAIEQSRSYFAWQHVLGDLFALAPDDSASARRKRIMDALVHDAQALEMLPLLNAVLSLEFPETPLTEQMSGEVRAGNLEDLMVRLLQASAARTPLLLFLEDTHWMDSASWALLRRCVEQVHPMMTVLGSRPVEIAEANEALRALVSMDQTRTLRLERLDPNDCVRLVARRLGVERLPDAAAEIIRERGEGHPYFSEEIGYALRDSGAVIIEAGSARMNNEDGGAVELDLPDTIEGIITSRIDRLTPQQQLTLKVASCIGRVFTMRLLRDVYPVDQDRAGLGAQMDRLTRLDLTQPESEDADPSWIFKHAITRQVTYDLMLYAQRKQLHEAIADWYEAEHPDDPGPYYPLLAHHWGRADNDEKAVQYLIRAAERAERANANVEVIEFVEEAMARAGRLAKPPGTMERARWLRMLGFAQNALGRLDEARASLEAALATIGFPVPGNTLSLIGSIARQIAVQYRSRRLGRPQAPPEPDQAARLEFAAETVQRLFIIYFFANDAARLLWTCLRSTNLAEAVGRDTPILIRCYTDLALALQSIPLQAQVDYYSERAMDAAESQHALADIAWANLGTSVALAATAQWAEIERRSARCSEISLQLGDTRRWEEVSANLALTRTIYGRFDDAETSLYLPVLNSARKRKVVQSEGWGLSLWGMNLLYQQRFDELDTVIAQLTPWYASAAEGADDIARLEVVALHLTTMIRREDAAGVEHWLEEGFRIIDGLGRPTQYRTMPATYLFTEAVIEWWRRGPDSDRRLRERRVLKLLGAMKTYASIFAIGRPRLAWLRGRHAWYAGDHDQAMTLWRACHVEATDMEMAWDAMLSASALACCLPDDEAHAAERAQMASIGATLAEEMGVPGSCWIPEPAVGS